MSFLAPLWLAAAAIASLGVVALHLIATQRPPASVLPTARFVPQGDARASSRAARPTDLLLLLLRCAALMLLGTAFAGPVTRSRGAALVRVIVADRSRGSLGDVHDSVVALVRAGDALVPFDSVATVVLAGVQDSARALVPGRARGSISAALVSARRAAREIARAADSVELVIVSPLTGDELDAASANAIAQWPGRMRLVRTAAAPTVHAAITLAADDPGDALRPVVAAINGGAARTGAAAVRIVRTPALATDSAAARAGSAIVVWPRIGTTPVSAQGLSAGNATLVAPLERMVLPQTPVGGRIVARWADGAPAAIESPLGRGCVRMIGVGVPAAGDVTLQPAFGAVARALLAPCDGANVGAIASDSLTRIFSRAGAAAPASALRATDESSPLAPWLIGAALLLLLGELVVRREPAPVHA